MVKQIFADYIKQHKHKINETLTQMEQPLFNYSTEIQADLGVQHSELVQAKVYTEKMSHLIENFRKELPNHPLNEQLNHEVIQFKHVLDYLLATNVEMRKPFEPILFKR